jgi:hypothetical protein
MFLALVALAWAAGPPDAEHRYWEAQLLESADGNLPAAIAIYADLARTLDGQSEYAELRARSLLAMGRAHLALGQMPEARSSFESCRRITTSGLSTVDTTACAQGARRVALEEGAIRTVPTLWTFDEGTHGFVLFGEKGSMAVEGASANRRLVWTQELDATRTAELVVAVQSRNKPAKGVRFSVRADGAIAVLELLVVDEQNRSYALTGKVLVADAELRTLEIRFDEMDPLDSAWPALDARAIAYVRLRDTTGSMLPEQRGRHRILIDDFAVF